MASYKTTDDIFSKSTNLAFTKDAFKDILKDKGVTKYKPKDQWNSDLLNEYVLEKELEMTRLHLENEKLEFETSLAELDEKKKDLLTNTDYDNMEFFFPIVHGNTSTYTYTKIYEPISILEDGRMKQWLFQSIRVYDTIKDVYLQFKVPETFEGLSVSEKLAILNSTISLKMLGNTIEKVLLLSALFTQLCEGKHIIQDDNMIQIPIYNFSQLTQNSVIGLPVCLMTYSQVEFIVIGDKILEKLEPKLVINGIVYPTEICAKLFRLSSKLTYLYITNKIIKTSKPSTELHFTSITKYFLLYFSPNYEPDSWDFSIEYPEVNSVSITADTGAPLIFYPEDIPTIDILGIKIFLIPFCEEFSTLEKIYETFNNKSDMITSAGVHMFRTNQLRVNIDTPNMDNYTMNIIGVSLNSFIIQHGMVSISFA